jgi:hypothetical protein
MLQAITDRQEQMQALAQEKGQMQTVLDTCAAELKVRGSDSDSWTCLQWLDCYERVQSGRAGFRKSQMCCARPVRGCWFKQAGVL